MSKQPEQVLEEQLVNQLQSMGYDLVEIRGESQLLANLKIQLEKHNKIQLSNDEFGKILNLLSKGSVFEKAKTLREKQHIVRDNGDSLYFEFLNTDHWCQNLFQVTQQMTMEGKYKNRYDVTLLINGLPLVQIELKRRGLELKEAFNQINRYQGHSFGAGAALFQYVQLFVISNGVNTKYYANNRNQSFKQTFYWTDRDNNRLTNILNGFTNSFLEPCHISKMICKYIVLNETHKILMVLRPYQFYAVEALIERVKNSPSHGGARSGYIWHTTGSGKTLTSFKASQILTSLPQVKKVVFVVDRKDLDYQTTREFDSFKKGSVDATENTRDLVTQLTDDTKLIVTTLQKLNAAISKKYHLSKMSGLKDERIVFIFDECHRSQFGETHNRIKAFFNNIQLFGFTGTPIFADNSVKNELGRRTTKDLFDECLHKYVITDAIRDENVLRFSIEYVGKFKRKDGTDNEIDFEVDDIDTKELMDSPKRSEKIVDYILAHHARKTHNQDYSAMFCVSSVESLIRYYDLFQKRKVSGLHDLKIATIFSYVDNEADANADGMIRDDQNPSINDQSILFDQSTELLDTPALSPTINIHSREKLDQYIDDYNGMFGTKFSTKDSQSFYNYYNDLSKKLKDREKSPDIHANRIDILLVVNMFLTGFDAKKVNTLYVDKNLKYHGLIQAYSRTNRILNEQKSQGNIVVFRNLKEATDEAITLFSNKDAIEEIIIGPFEDYVDKFNVALEKLFKITPTVNSVNDLVSEEDELRFVNAFRDLIRIKNVLESFADFSWKELEISQQTFEDFKSKYLDLHDKVKFNQSKEKVSILEEVDFELELIHRDEINVTYILKLLAGLKFAKPLDQERKRREIEQLLGSEVQLRSKKDLIEKFIDENLPFIDEVSEISDRFDEFWQGEQVKSFNALVEEENLDAYRTQKLIEDYLFAEREPIRDEILLLLKTGRPSLLQRKKIGDRILNKILDFVRTFIDVGEVRD
ncbi:type I restriction endonuclease subunit R [Dyadobacter sp. CY347]|uniref:type I restriction endonuclease subunit R n=1 Tax=Dyadobacter sp. CY347 TaxID=2909336 RepID=UPI001F270B07|nr:type I restriction endonuclease subunit R [Dyadobacter sp. CY347]MCF2491129.1 type I restriction endonuclease subunit R [Dyadobacter sp. CY347]